jgi:hypothetical protein
MGKNWNDLLSESRANTIFLTWEWLYTWAECFLEPHRQLFILTVFQENRLVGIAPWCIHRTRVGLFTLRQIEFLGMSETGSDYLDVLTQEGKEEEVALTIYHFLFREIPSRWDSLLLRNIPADSFFLLHFLNKIEEAGKCLQIKTGAFCPITTLPKTRTELMAGLSPNRRQQFFRHWRNLQKMGNVEHITVVPKCGENKETLERFCVLYSSRWSQRARQFYQFLEKFTTRSHERGWIQIDFLDVDGKNVAALYHMRYQDTLYMYLVAVDRAFNSRISVGNILIGLCLQKAVEDNWAAYDFLRGHENYKFHWANGGRRLLDLLLYQKRFKVLWLMIKSFLKESAKIFFR